MQLFENIYTGIKLNYQQIDQAGNGSFQHGIRVHMYITYQRKQLRSGRNASNQIFKYKKLEKNANGRACLHALAKNVF